MIKLDKVVEGITKFFDRKGYTVNGTVNEYMIISNCEEARLVRMSASTDGFDEHTPTRKEFEEMVGYLADYDVLDRKLCFDTICANIIAKDKAILKYHMNCLED